MKITVEMTEDQFDEFLQYRKEKQAVTCEYNEFRRKAYRLRERVIDCIQLNEKNGTATLSGFKDAQAVVTLAYDL